MLVLHWLQHINHHGEPRVGVVGELRLETRGRTVAAASLALQVVCARSVPGDAHGHWASDGLPVHQGFSDVALDGIHVRGHALQIANCVEGTNNQHNEGLQLAGAEYVVYRVSNVVIRFDSIRFDSTRFDSIRLDSIGLDSLEPDTES